MLAMKKILFTAVLLSLPFPCAFAVFFDHAPLDAILERTVDSNGLVDYRALENDHRSALESYLIRVADADLAGWPRGEKLAFWLNAYNARVLLNVIDNPGLKKVSEKFALMAKPFPIAGRKLSLYDIQYRILLNRVNPDNQTGPIPFVSLDPPEPRVYFGLVSGAVGGPRLRPFAFTPENVDRTLTQNATEFANSERSARLENGKLWVSSLLKWASKDFAAQGGIAAYIGELIDEEKRPNAEYVLGALQSQFGKAEYSYDWTINRQPVIEGSAE
jgi:hypothetical protein